jgi:DNA phosphorothioation-dependent restriction protein DptG
MGAPMTDIGTVKMRGTRSAITGAVDIHFSRTSKGKALVRLPVRAARQLGKLLAKATLTETYEETRRKVAQAREAQLTRTAQAREAQLTRTPEENKRLKDVLDELVSQIEATGEHSPQQRDEHYKPDCPICNALTEAVALLDPSKTILTNVNRVVVHLGGVAAVAEMTRSLTTSVHNWRADNRIPPRFYVLMTRELARRKAMAPPKLWGQEPLLTAGQTQDK